MKKILIGGSPCTHWSVIQNAKNREVQASGQGWELFKKFVIALEKFKPDYFIYENNSSIHQDIKKQIEKELQVNLLEIDSQLVSAQRRKRIYATNIEGAKIPEDRGILLQDILEYGETERKKSKTVRVGGSGSGWGNKHEWDMPNKDRVYTTTELERLQTMPDGYTQGIPENQRRKCLGNGWTAEVIIELMQYMKIEKDEEIIVVSLYDGIATGRYCLEKLGFTNVKYFAYEIDKYAMQVAVKNYPDIIECGDAFKVRAENWCIEEELGQ